MASLSSYRAQYPTLSDEELIGIFGHFITEEAEEVEEFEPQDSNKNKSYSGDLVDAVQSGVYTGAADIARGVTLGNDNFASDWLGEQADAQYETMTDESIQAIQNTGFNDDLSLKEGSSFRGGGLLMAQGVGSLAPSFLPGMALTRGLDKISKGAKVLDRSGKIVNKLSKSQALRNQVLGQGTAGGAMIGGSTAKQARDEVMKAPVEMLLQDPDFVELYKTNRREGLEQATAFNLAKDTYAEARSAEAFNMGAGIGAVSMGAANPLLGKIASSGASRGLRALGGGITEGAQEFAEGFGQEVATNIVAKQYDIDSDIYEGAVGSGATGAVIGFGLGGALGAAKSESNEDAAETVTNASTVDEAINNFKDSLDWETPTAEYKPVAERLIANRQVDGQDLQSFIDSRTENPNAYNPETQAAWTTPEFKDVIDEGRKTDIDAAFNEIRNSPDKEAQIDKSFEDRLTIEQIERNQFEQSHKDGTALTSKELKRQRQKLRKFLIKNRLNADKKQAFVDNLGFEIKRFADINDGQSGIISNDQMKSALEKALNPEATEITTDVVSSNAIPQSNASPTMDGDRSVPVEPTTAKDAVVPTHEDETGEQYISLGNGEYQDSNGEAWSFNDNELTPVSPQSANLPLETVAQTETLNPEETIQNEQTETQSQETSAKTQPGEQIDDASTQIEANTTSTATVPTGEQETTSVPTQQEEVGQAIARVQAHIEKYANKTAPTSADSEFNKDVKAVTDALDSNTGTPNDGYYFSTKVNSQYDQQEGVQRAVDKLLSGKSPELKATEATHIEDGEIERVTPEVVNESLSTAANNRPDKSKAEMKDWLIDAIDKTVIRLESTADHPPMSEYERKSGYTISGALKDKVGYKTFDVPGDGTFKVLNTREHLTRFKKKVLASSGFKETRAKAKTAKPSTKQADAKQLITQYLNEAGKKGVISKRSNKFPIKNSVRLEAYGMAVQIANNSDLSDADIKALFEGKQSDIAGNKELLRYEDGYSTEETKTEAPEQEVKSEPVAKESPQQNQDKLKDFGEVLDGAKKHTYTFTKALDEDIDVKEVPLSKSIPLPNYEKMISDGVDPVLVATIAQLRAEIKPRKPKRGASRWVDSVNSARNKIKGLMKGLLQPEDIYKSALGDGYYPIAQLAADILPSQIKDLAKFTLDKSFFSLYEGEENVTKWGVEKSGERNANASFGFGSNSTYFDTKQEALDYIKSNVSDTNTKTGKAQTKFDMWSERGKKGVFLGKKVASRKYIELKRFDTQKEATAYRDSHYDELIELLAKKKKVRAIRRIDNNPRVGTDYRDGKDVTPELFQETFGFRGVQFGNYVEGPRRQQDLNNAYDGLLDLADVLGIPPEALSLNGTLGLAFGARGSGGKNPAAAHYESGGININLTKLNGKGSLAHEFFHGLDNYFGTMDEGDSFLSEGKRDKRKVVQKDGIPTMVETVDADFKVRKEVYDAWKGLYKSIKNETKIIERSESLDKARGKDYWSTVREMTARSFERYVIDKLASKGFESDYLANIVSEEAHDAENKILGDNQAYPYPLNDEMEAVNNAYDNLFKTLKTKKTDKGTALYSKSNKPQAKSTVAQIKALLPRRVQNMVDAGKLKVVQSVDNISDKTYSFSNTEGIEGFYDPDADVLYLISDALDKDNLNSTLNHELYHRARATDKKFQAQLSKLDKQLQNRFKLAAKGVGSKADRDAYKRVMDANTGTADQLEEFQAYLITAYAKNPDSFKGAALKWIKDLYAAIRAVLIRNGIHPKNITPADLNALSKYGAKVKSDGSKLSRENPVALASEQGYKGNDEEEASEWNKAVAAGLDMSFKARMARAKEMGFITNFEDTLAKSSGDKNASTPSNRKIPQRFYHGTAADIEAFEVKHVGRKDKGWIGSGVYVALTPELANTYANVKAPSRSGKIHIDANVMPLHIRADKIYVADEATRAKVRNGSQEYVDNFTAKMQADGYEGAAYFHARGEVEIVIFDPKNVRSIHAAFDPANSDSSDLMASKDTYERFYSQLKREIQRSPDRFFDKSGGQIKAWLKSNAPKLGIKADEIYWSGVNEWLDIQDGKVSKSDMVGFLGENGVQVESVTLDREGIEKAYYPEDSYMHPVTGDVATMEEWRDSSEDYSDEGGETIDEQLESLMDVSGEEIDLGDEDVNSSGNVKHNTASLTLPGGTDYQELVLTIPTTDKFNESDETHFGDVGEGKQIAWIRHNTRTDDQGNETLFLEEVQSQRGQAGRTDGFKVTDDGLIKELPKNYHIEETKLDNNKTVYEVIQTVDDGFLAESLVSREDAIRKALEILNENNEVNVPPAPFVTDKNNKATNAYITLLLKKAISHAIDNGQTSISWTTADQQADRYDLSKQLEKLRIKKNDKGTYNVSGMKDGGTIFRETGVKENELAGLVGKSIAEKAVDGKEVFTGEGLNIKSPWTQAMYGDESGMNSQGKPALMTQAAREITKKLGGTISSVVLDTGTQPALIITPEMRSKVLNEGMPLFSKTASKRENSRINMHHKDVLKRIPELTEGAEKLANGEITRAEYGKLVDKYKPVEPYANVPNPATKPEMVDSLSGKKPLLIGKPFETIDDGAPVLLRLDIPAYKRKNVWVVTVHASDMEVIGYESVGIVNNATFEVQASGALKIATGERNKYPLATVNGEWEGVTAAEAKAEADAAINDPDWIQVGMDPERHGHFYDRATMMPVESADRVIQVGSLLLAKGAKEKPAKAILFSRSSDASWKGKKGFNDVSDATFETLGKVGKPLDSGLKDKAKSAFEEHRYLWRNKLRQGVVDQYDSFSSVLNDKKAWMMASLSNTGGAVAEAALEFGQPFMDKSGAVDIDTDKKSLAKIVAPLGEELDRFLMWIAGNRAEGLKLDGRENLFSDDDIANLKGLADGDINGKNRKALYNRVRIEFEEMHNAVVKMGVDTGLVSNEDAKLWKEQGFYVPFYRLADESATKTGPVSVSGLVRQQAYKKLKGADMQLDDLLGNTLMNWNHLIGASLKNQTAAQALKSAEQMGLAKSIPASLKGKNSVFVRADGKEQWYNIDESQEGALVLDSLTALNYDGLNNLGMKVMRKFKRALTIGVTASPEFKIANLIRDTIQAAAVADMSTNIAKNLYDGFKSTKRDSKTIAQMIAGGGAFGDSGYIHGGDPDAIKMVLEKGVERSTILDSRKGWKKLWDNYQDFGARLENVNRAANFEQSLAKGDDLLTANFSARDHLDFARTGSFVAVRALSQMVPFLNARLQGLDKLGRSVADKDQRKQFATVVGSYALMSVALYLSMKDDDDFKEAEQWERDTYHLFKLPGSDVMYRIPRPFEVGALANIAERAAEQLVDDEVHGELFAERLLHSVTETFALNPTPQLFKPIIETWANKSFFTGRGIESQSMQRLSKVERKKAWTSQTAIGASQVMDAILWDEVVLSPVQVEHLVNAYLGWTGATALSIIDVAARPLSGAASQPDKRIEDYPVIGRFVREGKGRNSRFVTEFYKQKKEIDQHVADIKRYRDNQEFDKLKSSMEEYKDDVRYRKMYGRIGRQISNINKLIRLVTANKAMSSAAKRKRIDALNARRTSLAKKAVARYTS